MHFGYILLGVLVVLASCGVALLIFFKITVGRRDSWRMPDEKIIGTGAKRALLVYQPSNGGRSVPQALALAKYVAEQGYTVTVNHPSQRLCYAPGEYDLILYGTPTYLGEGSKALRDYIQGHPVQGKRIFFFVTGALGEAPELEALKSLLPEGNEVHGVKIRAEETNRLLSAAKACVG